MSGGVSWNRFRWLMATWLCAVSRVGAANYYVHPVLGDDGNAGTSESAPLRTLARANKLNLHAGDAVLLAAGQQFGGQLAFDRLTGTEAAPIVFSSYPPAAGGGNQRASIDAKGYQAGVCLKNCAHVAIQNLLITANAGGMKPDQSVRRDMRCGILIEADQPGKYEGFSVSNIVVKDVFFEEPGFVRAPQEVKSANGTQHYGWGIRFLATSANAVMRDVFITDCRIENIEHTGLKLTADNNGLQHVEVQRVQIADTGGPGAQLSGVVGGHFSQLDVNRSGSVDDTRKWGRGSGLWTWGSSDVVIEKSRFQNSSGPGDSAGVHIDYNCRNVIVQYNFSAYNAGGFCEILGNNRNCAYRYNISINDGSRIKGENGAFQAGKILWTSGYVGKGAPHSGPFDAYIYNNTVYVGPGRPACFSIAPSTDGLLVANNIFYFSGQPSLVPGDQERVLEKGGGSISRALVVNNLFARAPGFPPGLHVEDEGTLFGDPLFSNPGGMDAADYIPRDTALVVNRGMAIPALPGDTRGLIDGLAVQEDFFGNPIIGLPDLGAVETER